MLKETEAEKNNRLFCHSFFIGGISIGGQLAPYPPLATPMPNAEYATIRIPTQEDLSF